MAPAAVHLRPAPGDADALKHPREFSLLVQVGPAGAGQSARHVLPPCAPTAAGISPRLAVAARHEAPRMPLTAANTPATPPVSTGGPHARLGARRRAAERGARVWRRWKAGASR